MAEETPVKMPDISLQSAEHEELLNIIDTLRSQGISRYVDLPQIIVTGLRFPTKDNLCTRFATELILRRGPVSKVTVAIIPDSDRTEEETIKLSAFTPPSSSISEFSNIVKSAEKAMGLDSNNTAFSKDILRVELSGPSQPNLTLVDLPGIFWAGTRAQSDADADLVQSMVKNYMKSKRSIILAVVSAKHDVANQIITKLAREIDPKGHRTLGIITKPDLLHAGSDSEAAFVELAKNQDVSFKLGWHVLKNRDYDTKDSSAAERDAAEKEFFQKRVWSGALPTSQLGIENLRPRLSQVLLGQILKELPSLMRDVGKELTNCKDKLKSLGAPRGSVLEQRSYLSDSSQQFVELIRNAIRGTYEDAFFGGSETDEGYKKRLRAVIQDTLISFAEKMRVDGHAQAIVDGESPEDPVDDDDLHRHISRKKYLESVAVRMRRNRGCELPGLFNPSIVDELFFAQSRPWQQILHDTEEMLVAASRTALDFVVQHISDTSTADGILRFIIRPNMEAVVVKLHAKVQEILRPHMRGHAITYNHYFTENLQKKRQQAEKEALATKLKAFFGGKDPTSENLAARRYDNSTDTGALLTALMQGTESDMSKFACMDATNAMEAYYKVALKTIVDSFGIYAVEECLMNELPDLFKPNVVFKLDDGTVSKIAGESGANVTEREELNRKSKILEETMTTLKRLKAIKGSDESSVDASGGTK